MTVNNILIKRLAWVSLICVHLVIIAGSVVRMTGSGMGCPDWPMCFGYAIPPTSAEQVAWSAGRDFKKGQMIVHAFEVDGVVEDRLLVASESFTTSDTFNATQWNVYDKHDYSIFNPVHTWIEFINRLIGAFTGLPVLLLTFASFVFAMRKKRWAVFVLALATLFMLGFEAWLGKLVVDGNLIPGSITIHMFGALVLVVLLLAIIRLVGERERVEVPKRARVLIMISLVFALVQVLWGTQVREEVDQLVQSGVTDRSTWVDQLSALFDIHRSFSWLVLLLNIGWIYLLHKNGQRLRVMGLTLALLIIQILGGVVLTYAGMPAALQPVHLFGGILMFGVLWHTTLFTYTRT